GWLGVDLFFVLSGYLITSLLLVEHRAEGGIRLGAFWGRRARRLLPALLVLVTAVSVYAWFDVAAIDLGAVRSDGLATLFFVANWHDIFQGASYWDRGLAPSMFAHTWSLAVEEQLYIAWPLVLAFVLRLRPKRQAGTVARVALVGAVLSAAIALGLRVAGASPERIYLGTDTRAVAVLLGAFVAGRRRTERRSDGHARRLEGAAIAGAAVLALAWWGLDGTSSSTYWGGLLGASALAALVVAAAADPRSTRLAAVLGVSPLRGLGLISYGLYLWHWPVYVVLSPSRTGLDGPVLLAVRLVVTFAISIASWALLERPIRSQRPAGWWSGRRGAASALGAMALAVVVLLAATAGAVDLPTEGLGDGVVRTRRAPTGAPKVVVIGDSVAASIAAPAIASPRRFGLDVVRSTVLGCQAVWDGGHQARGVEGDVSKPPACPPAVGALVAAERPDAVLVLYGGWTNADLRVDGEWTGACDPAYRALLRTRFRQVVADAGISGAPVLVANAARSTNTFRQEDTWERTACTNEVMSSVARAAPDTELIDLDGWLCPDGTCRERVDGVPLRSDGVHFQGPGGAVASEWLFDQVVDRAGLDRTTDQTGTRTPEYRATVTACRSFVQLSALTTGNLPDLLSSAEARADFADALHALDADLLADLPPRVADALVPITDPAFQEWAIRAVDRIARGRPVDPGEISPEQLVGAGKAVETLQPLC
ncbi:MAG: acyltransferase family protein, partial [Ilumatobacteraceae bacterium]|nr:acyltransferase family protein [Ilumatobacteraceae bacterium]